MTLHYTDDHLDVHVGDCRAILATLPAESVHCVVTSPPYWGLRDYGVSDQLGLEPTPEAYVANMVEVFREVRRVLRKDGTCWVNMGDGYAANVGGKPDGSNTKGGVAGHVPNAWGGGTQTPVKRPDGLKPKDLIGMPWRLAFALQADGWYLRSDIIWAKPNPMPESVTDRPTKSHEYVFLLAKGQWVTRVVQPTDLDRQRIHLLDYLRSKGAPVGDAARLVSVLAQAVLEFSEGQDDLGLPPLDAQVWQQRLDGSDTDPVGRLPVEHRAAGWASRFLTANCSAEEFLRELNGLWIALPDRQQLLERWCASELALTPSVDGDGEASVAIHDAGKVGKVSLGRAHGLSISRPTGASYFYDADAVREDGAGRLDRGNANIGARLDSGAPWRNEPLAEATGRNLRSVWTIATEPYPGAHFATFPQKLVEPCIKAGSPLDGVVLDPFAGSGTTGLVANRLGRRAILIDLSADYIDQAMLRNQQAPLGIVG